MKEITVADYFVEFLISNGIKDVFGYQGGMIAYIFDSLSRYRNQISYHVFATEQGASFAACAYSQSTGLPSVVITTSGPGFTNTLTGMANAWFDSIPVIFVSGNVNTKDKRRANRFRQNGFQEIQASKIAEPITKLTMELELGMNYIQCFNIAYKTVMTDRKGPVYIDFPINICREKIKIDCMQSVQISSPLRFDSTDIYEALKKSRRPVIIAGAGIKQSGSVRCFRTLVDMLDIPVVTTMPAIDVLATDNRNMIGYIGGTGRREPGIVLQNADFVLSIGTRLCSKQIGHNLSLFAPKAKKFIRVDIDSFEFERQLKKNEIDICADIKSVVNDLLEKVKASSISFSKWANTCKLIKKLIKPYDVTYADLLIKKISRVLPHNSNLVFDVGKNLIYGAQSALIKSETEVFMSAGLGAMGYSIPASIGAYLANGRPTYSFNGDGGAQMNIQELNIIAKENLPIKIFILNNNALGNIVSFQQMYLNNNFVATRETDNDYFSCDFASLAQSYGIDSVKIHSIDELDEFEEKLLSDKPVLFDIYYDDCPSLPGIVAGGDYLSGLDASIVQQITMVLDE